MRAQTMVGKRNPRRQLCCGSLACIFLSGLCGCTSKEPIDAALKGQPPTTGQTHPSL
jgi:hypothetical protein